MTNWGGGRIGEPIQFYRSTIPIRRTGLHFFDIELSFPQRRKESDHGETGPTQVGSERAVFFIRLRVILLWLFLGNGAIPQIDTSHVSIFRLIPPPLQDQLFK